MIDDFQQAIADSVEHDAERAEREARTQATAPGMQHPLGEERKGPRHSNERFPTLDSPPLHAFIIPSVSPPQCWRGLFPWRMLIHSTSFWESQQF